MLPLLFLLGACGTKRPPEDAHVIARPGEPCFEGLKPWEDPVGPPIQNTQNLPRCPRAQRPVDDWRFLADAGPRFELGFDTQRDWNFNPDAARDARTE